MSMDCGNKKLDFICQHCMDGSIIPIKIRLRDEDGELQEFKIHGYRDISDKVHTTLECKIVVRDTAKLVTIFTNHDGIWYLKPF